VLGVWFGGGGVFFWGVPFFFASFSFWFLLAVLERGGSPRDDAGKGPFLPYRFFSPLTIIESIKASAIPAGLKAFFLFTLCVRLADVFLRTNLTPLKFCHGKRSGSA